MDIVRRLIHRCLDTQCKHRQRDGGQHAGEGQGECDELDRRIELVEGDPSAGSGSQQRERRRAGQPIGRIVRAFVRSIHIDAPPDGSFLTPPGAARLSATGRRRQSIYTLKPGLGPFS